MVTTIIGIIGALIGMIGLGVNSAMDVYDQKQEYEKMAKEQQFEANQAELDRQSAEKQAIISNEMEQAKLDWEKEAFKNEYQIKVQDLQAAGLNPALAIGGSLGGGQELNYTSGNASNYDARPEMLANNTKQIDIIKALIASGMENKADTIKNIQRYYKQNLSTTREAIRELPNPKEIGL